MKSKVFKIIFYIYLFIQFLLFILTHTSFEKNDYLYCYIVVILAFLFNFIFIKKSYSFLFTSLALLFTVIADYFLLLYDSYYLIAMSVFLCAQICYGIRVIIETKNITLRIIHIIMRISLSFIGVVLCFIVLGKTADLVSIISVIYYINLVLSCVFAFINIKDNKYNLIFSIGLLLFVCCDLFVGINNLSTYFKYDNNSIFYLINNCDVNFSFIFYIPSQVLLSISLLKGSSKN